MKEFLSQRGVSFKEYDVSVDQEAALRMIRLSGQQGVPVIAIDDQVVIGFDRRRLEELLAKGATGQPRLGIIVADAATRSGMEGAYVGRVISGSLAEKAGLRTGDVIIKLGEQAIRNATDLQRTIASLRTGDRATLTYVRHGQRVQVEVFI